MKAYTLIGLAALVIGCGGAGNRNKDSGCTPCVTQDGGVDSNFSDTGSDGSNDDVYDAGTDANDSGNDTSNGTDSGNDVNDSGVICCDVNDGGDISDVVDASDEDSGRINNAPSVQLIYEVGHPRVGEVYTSRNVRRGRDTDYLARASDPDGDIPLECRF